MVLEVKFKGLVAAVFTPFDENDAVNLEEIPKYAKYLAHQNVKGILVNGTVGEGTSLTFNERKMILETWINVSKTTGQHIFVQIGGTNLKEIKKLAVHAEKQKVHAILCLPDLFLKPTSVQDLIFYMKTIGESAPCTPLLYYHYPSITGVLLDMRKFLEIGYKEISNLAGIKFSHPVLGDAVKCTSVQGGKFTIFHGYDQILSAAFAMGIDNVMITCLNYAPDLVYNIENLVRNGRNYEALLIEKKFMTLMGFVLNIAPWTSGFKAVTSIISGIKLGNTRSPLRPLTKEQFEKLEAELKANIWTK